MTKVSAVEESGQMILSIYRYNGIQPGQMMLFPVISAQFMAFQSRNRPAPSTENPDLGGHHRWSYLQKRLAGFQGPDLSAGIKYLIERGFLRQAPKNRVAYFLTAAGLAAS